MLKGKVYYSSNLNIDGIDRYFTYYIPLHFGEKDKNPLVILLHGLDESGQQLIKRSGGPFAVKADSSDYIIVYPDAIEGHWHALKNEYATTKDSVNDVTFISILIEYFTLQYGIDTKRIYAAGLNNGGKMALRLSCDIPYKITAVAAIAAADTITTTKCGNSVSVMNTEKYLSQKTFSSDPSAINELWNFFLSKEKK